MKYIQIFDKTIEPQHIQVRSKADISMKFTFPQTLPNSSTITFRFRGGRNNKNDWYKVQPFDSGFDGYFQLKTESASQLFPMLCTGKEFYVQYLVMSDPIEKMTTFEINIHHTLVQSIIEENKRIEIIVRLPNGEVLYVENPPTVTVESEQFDHLTILCPSMVEAGEPFKFIIRFEDKYYNPIEKYQKLLNIALIHNSSIFKQISERLKPNPQNGIMTIESKKIHKPGLFKIRVSTQYQSFDSNPILCVNKLKGEDRQLYWGFLHGHTRKSDGMISAEQYFQNLINAKLDFGTCSEHDHSWETTDADFSHIKKIVRKYNKRDDFVSFFGYEWGSWYTGGFGDVCIYHRSDNLPILRSELNKYNSIPKLFKYLKRYRDQVLLIAHHTAVRPGYRDWTFSDDSLEDLVEIYSSWGNQENSYRDGNILPPRYKLYSWGKYGDERGPVLEKEEGFVQTALKQGNKLGFTAGGDDHYGIYPSGPIDVRNGIYPPGILGVWAKDLTKENIWEALKSRKCYGTTGPRIIGNFWINRHSLGDIIDLEENSHLKTKREILIKVFSGLTIKKVELIRNNEIFASLEPDTHSFKETFIDNSDFFQDTFMHPEKSQEFMFYYVRIHLPDNHMAWLSPIWITK
ncbi:MAG: DUF3604 domain-containing protein [Promethearchaeia archaeon]